METRSRYLFDNSEEGEGDRLAGIQAAFDPGTRHHLERIGVGPGWRCLEVGAGAGSVARWLCERVGRTGHVLATDINPALVEGLALDNLEVRRHDILNDELPEGAFDLVHSRLVLEHLPGREDALRRMAAALAPGGWLVVEDMDWSPAGSVSRRGAALFAGVLHAFRLLLASTGYDKGFGRRLPLLFNTLGLVDVGAEGRVVFLVGGTPSVAWARPTLDRIRPLLLEKPVLKRFPALRPLATGSLDKVDEFLADPGFAFAAPAMVAAWGRRPEE